MAKFHGFEIKNMKTFMGMEGYGTQGDVWLNGKKLGFWTNDGNGGDDRFDMPHEVVHKLNDLCAAQCPECAIDDYGMHIDADLSLVLAHLADLKDVEKDWKKLAKQGYSLVTLSSERDGRSVHYPLRTTDRAAIVKWLADNAGAEMNKYNMADGTFEIYDSTECFEIGDPLTGADDVAKLCDKARKEREEIWARIKANAAK